MAEIPLYNQDVESGAADALLNATPEHNQGVPGVLRNAIDWASRPPSGSVLAGMPTAIFGASPGVTGTARAQSQLRQAFVFTNTPALPQPEILVHRGSKKFAAESRLTDEKTREFNTWLLRELADWTLLAWDARLRRRPSDSLLRLIA